MSMIINTHTRQIPARADVVGRLVESIGSAAEDLWPAGWPQPTLDRGFSIGSSGRYAGAEYRLIEHEPRRRAVFAISFGRHVHGTYTFQVRTNGLACALVHTTAMRVSPLGWLMWHLAIKPVHNTVIGALLDNVMRTAGDAPSWDTHAAAMPAVAAAA